MLRTCPIARPEDRGTSFAPGTQVMTTGATRCSERAQSPDPKTGARRLCPGHPSHDDRGTMTLPRAPES